MQEAHDRLERQPAGLWNVLGWRPIAAEWYEGQPVVVMAIETASDHP